MSLLVETPSTGTFFKFIKFLQAPDFKAVSDVATFYWLSFISNLTLLKLSNAKILKLENKTKARSIKAACWKFALTFQTLIIK